MSSASWKSFSLRTFFTLRTIKFNQENWDCLDLSRWSLGMKRVSVASGCPWGCLGRTLRWSSLFRKSSWRIWRVFSLLMFNSSAIVLRAHRWFHVTISRTFAVMPAFREVEGPPLLGSSWRFSRPPQNRLNHLKTLLRLKTSSSQTAYNNLEVSIEILYSLKQNFIFISCSLAKKVNSS
jgi:hypothetical protein